MIAQQHYSWVLFDNYNGRRFNSLNDTKCICWVYIFFLPKLLGGFTLRLFKSCNSFFFSLFLQLRVLEPFPIPPRKGRRIYFRNKSHSRELDESGLKGLVLHNWKQGQEFSEWPFLPPKTLGKHKFPENILIRQSGKGGSCAALKKKTVSVGTFSTFHHPIYESKIYF